MQAADCRDGTQRKMMRMQRGSARAAKPGLLRSLVLNGVGLGVLWMLYSAVRTVTADSFGVARENADRLIAFQERIGLPSEAIIQSSVLDYEWLLRSANVYYFGVHFPAMLIFFLWGLFLKREAMPRIRFALIGSTIAGLAIHLLFPLAPPRMLRLSGFVDTARIFGPDPYALGVARAANELAAMPSMHVGWALLLAMAVISVSRSRWRWLVLFHPIVTTLVVVVTANHYWTDVFAGAALATIGWKVAGIVRPVRCLDEELLDDDETSADADQELVLV
jgi:hypothetical protein